MTDFIEVKVVRVNGEIKNIAPSPDVTLGEALTLADMELRSGEVAKIVGTTEAATLDTVLQDGATVMISVGAKGNS